METSIRCPRIVAQSPYLTRALDWLGCGEYVVGVSRHDRLRDTLPRTGGIRQPDVPAIDALAPDLVLVSSHTDAGRLAGELTPPARVVQVDGFESMAGTETMLRTLACASAAPGGEARVDAFARDWRAAAAAVGSAGRRVLVLSECPVCSSAPYSFGRGHVVGDLFARAGFEVAETAPRLRHLRDGEEFPDILSAVERLRSELVVWLTHVAATPCNARLGVLPVRLVMVDGDNFCKPGPAMLDGLAELAGRMKD